MFGSGKVGGEETAKSESTLPRVYQIHLTLLFCTTMILGIYLSNKVFSSDLFCKTKFNNFKGLSLEGRSTF